MKIAIVGAGLAGLSCAYELNKYGINPTIFEKKSFIGDAQDYTITTLRMFDRFKGSPMKYLRKSYGLKIKPISYLNELQMLGPSKRIRVNGKLGYTFKKNREKDSLEKQIANHFNPNIVFNTYVKPLKLKDHYDYVVCATGDCTTAKELDIFKPSYNSFTRISTILGNFQPNSMIMWINKEYAKNGYVFLLPYNKRKACLSLTVDYTSNSELDFYWKRFLDKEKIQYTILETKDIEHNLGFIYPLKIDNVYLIGNSAGLIDNIFGFGAINAIESGMMAGRCIANSLDYNKIILPILNSVKPLYEYRKLLNSFDNEDYDKLLSLLNFPVAKQFIYNNPFYKAQYGAKAAKFLNNVIHKRKSDN